MISILHLDNEVTILVSIDICHSIISRYFRLVAPFVTWRVPAQWNSIQDKNFQIKL